MKQTQAWLCLSTLFLIPVGCTGAFPGATTKDVAFVDKDHRYRMLVMGIRGSGGTEMASLKQCDGAKTTAATLDADCPAADWLSFGGLKSAPAPMTVPAYSKALSEKGATSEEVKSILALLAKAGNGQPAELVSNDGTTVSLSGADGKLKGLALSAFGVNLSTATAGTSAAKAASAPSAAPAAAPATAPATAPASKTLEAEARTGTKPAAKTSTAVATPGAAPAGKTMYVWEASGSWVSCAEKDDRNVFLRWVDNKTCISALGSTFRWHTDKNCYQVAKSNPKQFIDYAAESQCDMALGKAYGWFGTGTAYCGKIDPEARFYLSQTTNLDLCRKDSPTHFGWSKDTFGYTYCAEQTSTNIFIRWEADETKCRS